MSHCSGTLRGSRTTLEFRCIRFPQAPERDQSDVDVVTSDAAYPAISSVKRPPGDAFRSGRLLARCRARRGGTGHSVTSSLPPGSAVSGVATSIASSAPRPGSKFGSEDPPASYPEKAEGGDHDRGPRVTVVRGSCCHLDERGEGDDHHPESEPSSERHPSTDPAPHIGIGPARSRWVLGSNSPGPTVACVLTTWSDARPSTRCCPHP